MKKSIVSIILTVVLLAFTGCGGGITGGPETLSGRYYYVGDNEWNQGNYLEFREGSVNTEGGFTYGYVIEDDVLTITMGGIGVSFTLSKDRNEFIDMGMSGDKFVKGAGNDNDNNSQTNDGENGDNVIPPIVDDNDPILDLPLKIVNNTVSIGDSIFIVDNDGNARKYNRDYHGNYDSEDVIISDVRSILIGSTNFFIKNDNSLWAVGSNKGGVLGDGTGVDRDEPVKILENVANVYNCRANVYSNTMYAITTDKTMYKWGGGEIYEPQKFLKGIIAYYCGVGGTYDYAIKTDGSLWEWHSNKEPEKIMSNVRYMDSVTWQENYVIKGDNSLWKFVYLTENGEKILNDVEECFVISSNGSFAIKTDGTFWGWGSNSNGELGDGTKINRETPVELMAGVDVIDVFSYYYRGLNGELKNNWILDADNNLWNWGSDDPTPKIEFDSIGKPIFVSDGWSSVKGVYMISEVGTLHKLNGQGEWEEIIENIMTPN